MYKIILGLCLILTTVSSFCQDGSLDVSFDFDGSAFGSNGSGNDTPGFSGLTTDINGKIVIAGSYFNGTKNDFSVFRFNSNGSPDISFSGDGKVLTSVILGNNECFSVAIQNDGKIIAGGHATVGSGNQFALVRYNSDGSLDNTFDSDGIVITDMGFLNTYGYSIVIQPDGKIVLAGSSGGDFAMARYNTDGSLDITFDSDGKVYKTIGTGNDESIGISLQNDGKIILVGYSINSLGDYDYSIARFNSDGSSDLSFDGDGVKIIPTGSNNDYAYSVKIQSDNKIILGGTIRNGANNDFGLLRLNSDGSLDLGFGINGIVLTSNGTQNDSGMALALQPDGKILLAGYTGSNPNVAFFICRYLGDGILDISFDGDGKLISNISGSNNFAKAIHLQTDSKILVTGNCGLSPNTDIGIARFNNSCAIPATPTFSNYVSNLCNNEAFTYSVNPNSDASSYTWTLPGGWSGTSTTNSITATAGTSGGTISVIANNGCGSSSAQTLSITVNSAPATPGTISGTTTICSGSSQTYSVTNNPAATSYTWTLPGGWSGTSTTNSITATAGASGGTISVIANNGCGSSSAQTLTITVNSAPATPAVISGSTTVCSATSQTYSVTNDPAATSYTWTLPGGWSGTSTTNSITATAGTSGGTISVTANNGCGSSSAQTLSITVNSAPATPGTISGTTTICSGSSQTYSVNPNSDASSYTWTLPGSWSGTSTSNSITATAGSTGGTLSVVANNGCGSSSAQTLTITVNSAPATPGTISGTTTICSGSLQTYSVTNNPAATSYTWTLPGGWSGTSTTNSITATAGASGGTISVTANNGCGSSSAQTQTITVNSVPATPGVISGSTTVCSGTSQIYSVTNDPAATSYTWTLPGGWSGTSTTNSITATAGANGGTISVIANNGCGSSLAQTLTITVNSTPATPAAISGTTTICSGTSQTYSVTNDPSATSYTWSLPGGWSGTATTNSITATAGTSGGTISVTANNGCGSSSAQTLSITVNSAPATPGVISGSTTVCSGTSQTYSVTNDPAATSCTWTLPGGWSGTSTTNSITATAGANGGTISVIANNGCGSSTSQSLIVGVETIPNPPSLISGDDNVCEGSLQSYSVTLDPLVTTYNWTLPAGSTGSSFTNSIDVTIGSTSGSIIVDATNNCGTSSAQFMNILVNELPTVSWVLDPSTICLQNGLSPLSVASPSGGVYSGSGVVGTNFDPTVTGAGTFQLTYSYTDVNGCSNSVDQNLTVEDCASISSIDQDYFILYPNPFKDVLTIQFENDDERLIELLSITGQIISSSKFNGNKVQISEEGLESGVYYIRINHERLTKVIKL